MHYAFISYYGKAHLTLSLPLKHTNGHTILLEVSIERQIVPTILYEVNQIDTLNVLCD